MAEAAPDVDSVNGEVVEVEFDSPVAASKAALATAAVQYAGVMVLLVVLVLLAVLAVLGVLDVLDVLDVHSVDQLRDSKIDLEEIHSSPLSVVDGEDSCGCSHLLPRQIWDDGN